MASLDLSAAFDIVNVGLLVQRLKIIDLPKDLNDQLSNWRKTRYLYVTTDGLNSCVHATDIGMVQESILGPILYSKFVSPLFDLTYLNLYADYTLLIQNFTKLETIFF